MERTGTPDCSPDNGYYVLEFCAFQPENPQRFSYLEASQLPK